MCQIFFDKGYATVFDFLGSESIYPEILCVNMCAWLYHSDLSIENISKIAHI